MEIIEKSFNINDGTSMTLNTYGVKDITELEEGMIFGTITPEYNINVISPVFEFINGELKCWLFSDDDLVADEFEIDANVFSDKKIPLIFKKLDGNRAQELLSGEIFTVSTSISNLDVIDDFNIGLENFQKGVEAYSNDNVFILGRADDFNGEDIDGIFVVNDAFKSLYSDETLSKSEEVVKTLKSIKEQARAHFKQKLQMCVDKAHSIAKTENLIYDLDHSETERKTRTM